MAQTKEQHEVSEARKVLKRRAQEAELEKASRVPTDAEMQRLRDFASELEARNEEQS